MPAPPAENGIQIVSKSSFQHAHVVAKLFIAVILFVAGISKSLDPGSASGLLRALGVFDPFNVTIYLISLSEVLLALYLWVSFKPLIPLSIAIVILLLFTGGLSYLIYEGSTISCGCFGRSFASDLQSGIWRNVFLVSICVLSILCDHLNRRQKGVV